MVCHPRCDKFSVLQGFALSPIIFFCLKKYLPLSHLIISLCSSEPLQNQLFQKELLWWVVDWEDREDTEIFNII